MHVRGSSHSVFYGQKYYVTSKIWISVFAEFPIVLWFFGSYFRSVCRIDSYDIPLERYVNCATFMCRTSFQIPYGLKVISNKRISIFAKFSIFLQFFGSYFRTVCPIDAYDIPLERCVNFATFLWRTCFQISYRSEERRVGKECRL